MKLYVRLEAPFEWVRVNGKDIEAFGEVPSLAEYPLSDEEELIAVVPGEWVTAHRVNLPARTKRQFQAAIPYALEETISEEVEHLHFVCPQWKASEECTVYVVAKDKMRFWQALADDNLLPVDRLLPDHALVPFHEAADCSIALAASAASLDASQQDIGGSQQIIANHRLNGGVCIEPDFLEIWLMDVPMNSTIAVNDQALTEQLIEQYPDRDFRHWAFGNKLAHWLEQPHSVSFDLYSEEYRPSVRHLSWRSFAIPAALVVAAIVISGLYDTYRYFALHAEIRQIDAEQQEIVRASFPELDYVEPSKERYMMEQSISRMGGKPQTGSAQSMLAETAAVLRRHNISLSNVIYRDSKLVITCKLTDFSQVDQLTSQLNARPRISARLESSAADEGTIVASYILTSS